MHSCCNAHDGNPLRASASAYKGWACTAKLNPFSCHEMTGTAHMDMWKICQGEKAQTEVIYNNRAFHGVVDLSCCVSTCHNCNLPFPAKLPT